MSNDSPFQTGLCHKSSMMTFGAKTTAQQVVQGLDLTGKGVLVTGGI